jgi:hypothetical protein
LLRPRLLNEIERSFGPAQDETSRLAWIGEWFGRRKGGVDHVGEPTFRKDEVLHVPLMEMNRSMPGQVRIFIGK